MCRIIQSLLIVLLSTCLAITALAGSFDYSKEDLSGYPTMQPNLKVRDESDYSRDGEAVYFFGGVLYADRFLSSSSKSLFNGAGTLYTYIPDKTFPSSFWGFQLGFGKQLSHHIDMQMAYLQYLKESKSSTTSGVTPIGLTVSSKMNGMLAAVGYTFNPDDQFQVMAKVGAVVDQFYTTSTVTGTSVYTTEDDTKVDPVGGLDFLIQLTKNLGIRMSGIYIADTQSVNSSGEVNGFVGLNYIV
ncbi:MAG: hypothetical protein ACD_70C00089G0002 [uncultured bacterium]|nr:MAG: hypothetical protein ACD_70C00089G0002 [uncultured bacterium]OGT33586.1 MAG: hypothetical protein A3C44_01720 [Gammaproteobacteria bacterium RIFCSPHIGHO2_02_FULL_39_13]OGT49600.1 MAG: hypothetical protein A3E53_00465 [Gammaproteobacteria bacterium RIFCSPHIGHO2_12_FULL_39_24]